MDDLVFRTASELAHSIRQGEVSASEVLEVHLRQIEAHNPRLNAVVTLDTEGAVILGKTNLPEMAGDEQTNSPLFGRTHNP
jgi:amidase